MALPGVTNYTFSSRKPVYGRAVASVLEPEQRTHSRCWVLAPGEQFQHGCVFGQRTPATLVEILTSGVAPVRYCSRSRCSIMYRPLFLPPWRLRGQIHHPPFRAGRLFPQCLLIAEGLEGRAIGAVTYRPQTCMTRSIWGGFYLWWCSFCETM